MTNMSSGHKLLCKSRLFLVSKTLFQIWVSWFPCSTLRALLCGCHPLPILHMDDWEPQAWCGVQTTVKAVTGVLIMNATGRWIDLQRCERKLLAVKRMNSLLWEVPTEEWQRACWCTCGEWRLHSCFGTVPPQHPPQLLCLHPVVFSRHFLLHKKEFQRYEV